MRFQFPRLTRNLFHKLHRTHPALKRITLTAVTIIVFWIYNISYSERTNFESHIDACDWSAWESWPQEARPHHAVLIADPQLVDPHTYPGRPWPLSTLTERYTDRYMKRSFRLINTKLDPDSVIFLGDLFDGGREWATAQTTDAKQRGRLPKRTKDLASDEEKDGENFIARTKRTVDEGKRRLEQWGKAFSARHPSTSKGSTSTLAEGEDDIEVDRDDLMRFVYGEDGRWKGYGNAQWDKEYDRFGKIFLDADQLYPDSSRHLSPTGYAQPERINIDNGGHGDLKAQYATTGGKTRSVLTGLAGNHDVGFGSGVQIPVRVRFKWHFGESNRVDILGNHTFVSIDAPSLAASRQFEANGQETNQDEAKERKLLWKPPMDFLNDLPTATNKAVNRTLQDLYPEDSLDYLRPELPLVLLTHVPLFREPDTDCGELREKGHALSITGGYQYQNVLTQTLSKTLIQSVSAAGDIVHAFSGDDHDYCDVTHRYNVNVDHKEAKQGTWVKNIREETVKSFSWAMGVRRPGFMLVSLWNPIDTAGRSIGTPSETVQSHLCLLPDQLGIFIHYAQLAALTLAVLLVRAVVIAFRHNPQDLEETDVDEFVESSLPQFAQGSSAKASSANGYANSTTRASKGRHRASSTGLKPLSNGNLGVQRSANARARSVSPGADAGPTVNGMYYYGLSNGPLIDKAGYYPPVPDEENEDEEARIGDLASGYENDSQAKWRRRPRTRGWVARVWDEFSSSLFVVALAAGSFYIIMIRTG